VKKPTYAEPGPKEKSKGPDYASAKHRKRKGDHYCPSRKTLYGMGKKGGEAPFAPGTKALFPGNASQKGGGGRGRGTPAAKKTTATTPDKFCVKGKADSPKNAQLTNKKGGKTYDGLRKRSTAREKSPTSTSQNRCKGERTGSREQKKGNGGWGPYSKICRRAPLVPDSFQRPRSPKPKAKNPGGKRRVGG